MSKLTWTLAATLALGGSAEADSLKADAADAAAETVTVSGSARGVAQDYLVMPEGGEVTGQMKFIMSDPVLANRGLKFTDLALFGITGRWSLFEKLELAGSADFLPKQPSYTDEKPWQSVSFALRSPLAHRVALAVSGGGGHLIDHTGMWTREAMMLEWKHPICCDNQNILAFDMQGGIDGLGLSAPGVAKGAFMTELGYQLTTTVRDPRGYFGGWLGLAYAVPVQHSGTDPTTGMGINPQNRLDFHLGAVVSLEHTWDLFVDFAVIDRGDVQDATTRLPILDGGFDQKQVIFGITRRIEPSKKHRQSYDDGYALAE
jgi:hypothetical protein